MFEDRKDAGLQIAKLLGAYKNARNAIVLGIPRGGVEIGYYLAKALDLPLSIVVVKKLGHPYSEEYAIGAVGKEAELINEQVIEREGIHREYINREIERLRTEVSSRYEKYVGGHVPDIKNKSVIVCDDGVATGITLMLSIEILRKQNPKKIIAAVAVAPDAAIEKLKLAADEVYCPLVVPALQFFAIGQFYKSFQQVEDKDAARLLKEAER